MKGIFITGTDTGVGKTFVTAGILKALSEMGYSVCPMKPVETGCSTRDGRLIPHDTIRLIKASGTKEPLDIINPYRFKRPLAPAVAAELEGIRIQKRKIISICKYLLNKYDFVMVEGAGGIMVPVYKRYLYLDLIEDIGIPVVIVSRPGLGTINHTLLTIEIAKARDIKLSGVIINYSQNLRKGIAERTNPGIINRISGIPVIGTIPYLTSPDKPRLFAQIAQRLIGI
jgi:dethiobiotin synthetase